VIPFDYITEWRAEAPWIDDAQVEQDLVISRALVEIFRHPALADSLALRGGTALSKLQLRPPARYSEDIDLVQTTAQPAGPMMNALRAVLEPWLGKPKWKQGEGRITFYFRYTAEGASKSSGGIGSPPASGREFGSSSLLRGSSSQSSRSS